MYNSYCIAELVYDDKENSDWLIEQSEFSFADFAKNLFFVPKRRRS